MLRLYVRHDYGLEYILFEAGDEMHQDGVDGCMWFYEIFKSRYSVAPNIDHCAPSFLTITSWFVVSARSYLCKPH